MISFILVYLAGIPLAVFLHEFGHACGSLLTSKERVAVYLGPMNETNKEQFRISKISFHIRWAYYGFCVGPKSEKERTGFQRLLFFAGGPAASLSLAVLSFIAADYISHWGIQNFIKGFMYFNFYLFIGTIIPVIYPKWVRPYAGHQSDGYQILKILQLQKKPAGKSE